MEERDALLSSNQRNMQQVYESVFMGGKWVKILKSDKHSNKKLSPIERETMKNNEQVVLQLIETNEEAISEIVGNINSINENLSELNKKIADKKVAIEKALKRK